MRRRLPSLPGAWIAVLLLTTCGFATAQEQERGTTEAPVLNPRETPLGTQRPRKAPDAQPPLPPYAAEPPAATIERALAAHGGRQALAAIQDSVSEGTLTMFGSKGPIATYDVTVLRKGDNRVQRIVRAPGGQELRQGTDGIESWESANGMVARVTGGRTGALIESQTVRSVRRFLEANEKGLAVRDAGVRGSAKAVELEIPQSGQAARKTVYQIDPATSHVTRMEFVTGEGKSLFNQPIPILESWIFSDYRMVGGVPTPFRLERFQGGLKIEEMQFKSVRHNTGVQDDAFQP